jgi:hypothetical protein
MTNVEQEVNEILLAAVRLEALYRQEKKQPNLGLATTQELLEELMARARVGGYDQYRTVDPQ